MPENQKYPTTPPRLLLPVRPLLPVLPPSRLPLRPLVPESSPSPSPSPPPVPLPPDKEGDPARGEPGGEGDPPFRGTVMTKWWTLGGMAAGPPSPSISLSGIEEASDVAELVEEKGDEEAEEEVEVEMEMWSGAISRFFFS